MDFKTIKSEIVAHSPLTALGALSGIVILFAMLFVKVSAETSLDLFEFTHPLHVLLSAFATIATFRRAHGMGFWKTAILGYIGSVGICTISDCVIPYLGEWILGFPNREFHFCFIEDWWLVNPIAFVGTWLGVVMSKTRLPHAFHVFVSTWASLFHITTSMVGSPSVPYIFAIGFFLFISVLIPCCVSDIILPLVFVECRGGTCGHKHE